MPVRPEDGATVDSQAQPWWLTNEPLMPSTSSQVSQPILPAPAPSINDNEEPAREGLTIRIPGRYPKPHAPECHPTPIESNNEPTPMDLADDEADSTPQYVGHIHDIPSRSTRSDLVRSTRGGTMGNAEAEGAMLAFSAFENLEPAFAPNPTMPDPQTVNEALAHLTRTIGQQLWTPKSTTCVILMSSKKFPVQSTATLLLLAGYFTGKSKTAHSSNTKHNS